MPKWNMCVTFFNEDWMVVWNHEESNIKHDMMPCFVAEQCRIAMETVLHNEDCMVPHRQPDFFTIEVTRA